MNYKLSKYIIITDSVIDQKHSVVYSTINGSITILAKSLISNLMARDFKNIDLELFSKLIDLELLSPEHIDETETVIDEMKYSIKDSKSLGFVITPTANCQLGCNYCGQVHSKVNMSDELSLRTYNHIKNKLDYKNYKNLDITWYGAEPLMGINSMRNLSFKLIDLAKTKGMSYNSNIITNGLNLNERNFIDLVKNMNITSYQITLDGTKEAHDNSRYTKKGKPTFDIIMNNIIQAVNHDIYVSEGVTITIRMNVHKKNYKDIICLIEYFHEIKIHEKIYLSFAPVHDWGDNDADREIGIDIKEFSDMEIEWYIRMKELGYQEHNLIPNRILNTCMTTDKESELIDAKGEISYCWEVPYTPTLEKNNDFIIGNLLQDENIEYKDEYLLRDWFDDIKNEEHNSINCKKCIYLPVCGGQCPISWYKGKPACPSFKYNMEKRLLIEQFN